MQIAPVLHALEADFERTVADLVGLARIPSVSAAGFDTAQVVRSAERVAALLQDAGLGGVELLRVGDAHPAVYGEWLGARREAPTVLIYAHHDVRRTAPYDAYAELPFDVPVRAAGDAWARYEVRIEEMRQALRIVRAVVEGLPSGPIFSRKPIKNPKAARIPAGEAYAAIESPRGELGFYLVSDGKALPWRLKINAPSFCNLQVVPHVVPGHLIADVVAILGSLDPVLGDVDR